MQPHPNDAWQDWRVRILNTPDYWPDLEQYPAITAHEAQRLHDLLEAGQVFGLWMQLRDLIETLIKFPTLCIVSWLYHLPEEGWTEPVQKLLAETLTPQLSLGKWQELANQAKALCPNTLKPVQKILQDLLKTRFGKPHYLVKWRNQMIGHGALALDLTPAILEDLEKKLQVLSEHLKVCRDAYIQLNLYADELLLAGPEKARQMPNTATLTLQVHEDRYPLHPWLNLKEGRLYFFDSQTYARESDFLDYVQGQRQCWFQPELDTLQAKLRAINLIQAGSAQELSSQYFLSALHQDLEKLSKIKSHHWMHPVYLTTWLKTALTKENKGLLLLQMDMGMGKSSWVKALDPLQTFKIETLSKNRVGIRAYYFNDNYLAHNETFLNELMHNLCSYLNENKEIKLDHKVYTLSRTFNQASSPQLAFADMLTKYMQDIFPLVEPEQEKCLLILDGLDELPVSADGNTPLTFIPQAEQLPDNVYLLLTCRTRSEMPDHIQQALRSLHFIDSLTVSATASSDFPAETDNQILLKKFLKKQLPGHAEHTYKQILAKAEYRFLYLHLYILLMQSQVSQTEQSEDVWRDFFNALASRMANKHYTKLLRLLGSLALAPEPVTLFELAYLAGLSYNFELLIYLYTLQPLLRNDRSHRGNLLSLHWEAKAAFERLHPELLMQLKNSWHKRFMDLYTAKIEVEQVTDSNLYLLAHIGSWTELEPDTDLGNWLFGLAQGLKQQTEHTLKLKLKIYDQCLRLYTSTAQLIGTQIQRGDTHTSLCHYQEALKDFNQAIERFFNNLETGCRYDNLAEAYSKRGRVHHLLFSYADASEDYNLAIKIYQALERTRHLPATRQLTFVYLLRSDLYYSQGVTFAAGEDIKAAIKIWQKDTEDWYVQPEIYRAYLSRISIYHDDHTLNKRKHLPIINKIIENLENQNQGNLLSEQIYLSSAYCQRANILARLMHYPEALQDYDQAINIQEALKRSGQLLDHSTLASLYLNRGYIYFFSGSDYKKACQDTHQAIAVFEALSQTEKFYNQLFLVSAYANLGLIYTYLIRDSEATWQAYDQALSYLENVKHHHEQDMLEIRIKLLCHQGLTCAYTYQDNYAEALKYLGQAIKLSHDLEGTRKTYRYTIQSCKLYYRFYRAQNGFWKSLNVLRSQIIFSLSGLLSVILADEQRIWRSMKQSIKETLYKGHFILEHYNRSLVQLNRLKTSRQLDDPKMQANFHLHRGVISFFEAHLKQSLGFQEIQADYRDSLHDFNQAIKISEKLLNIDEIDPSDGLIDLYYLLISWYMAQNSWVKSPLFIFIFILKCFGLFGKEVKKSVFNFKKEIKLATISLKQLFNHSVKSSFFSFLGGISWLKKDYINALRYYDVAINSGECLCQLDSNHHSLNSLADMYKYRGLTYDSLNRHEEALRDHDEAISILKKLVNIKPSLTLNLAEVYLNRGLCYHAQQQFDLANVDGKKSNELALLARLQSQIKTFTTSIQLQLHPQQVNAQPFLFLIAHSLSLSANEKKDILHKWQELEPKQIEQLMHIFLAEALQFENIEQEYSDPEKTMQIKTQKQIEWQALEANWPD